jgi:hypothetical protein
VAKVRPHSREVARRGRGRTTGGCRIVELLTGPSHAIRDRQALALRLLSEMAIFQAGAKRTSRDEKFGTFEKRLFYGLGVAAVLVFGTTEGRAAMYRALLMSQGLAREERS